MQPPPLWYSWEYYKSIQIHKINCGLLQVWERRIYDDEARAEESEIIEFFELANLAHKYLKFNFNIYISEAVFLDTKDLKNQMFIQIEALYFETFNKPTETFMFLHRCSTHPNATFRGFIKGEIIQYMRNTSGQQKARQLI